MSDRMRDQTLDLEVGRRVHLLVGLALVRGAGPRDLVALAAETFTSWPTTRGMAPSARLRCVTAAAVYLTRCRPVGFILVGIEEPLGGGVADLLWAKGRQILVDELKSGIVGPTDRRVAAQVARFRAGGSARWSGRFLGVRVLPLAGVRHSWLASPDGRIQLPISTRGLEVR